MEELAMQREMLELATGTNNALKDIFDAVCRRNPAIAPHITFPRMRSAMQRARAKVRPNVPGNLRELAVALEAYPPAEAMYRGIAEGNDGSVALIFASDRLLEALGDARELYVDGTFKVAPNHPQVAQLWTMHIRVMGIGIAAVYVLCSARTRALYTAILSRITLLVPALVGNVGFIMGDYEGAAMGALREAFPGASLHGCWFHYNQALVRRWRRLGLTGAPTSVLHMAMALPLAPGARFEEGLRLLATEADTIGEMHPNVLQFMLYLRNQWGPLTDVVSVYGCPSRTNNIVESFHNTAQRKLGGLHPNIWIFIERLFELAINQGMDLERARNGARVRRARTLRNVARDMAISMAQRALDHENVFTLMQFLQRCARRAGAFQVAIGHYDEQNGEAAALPIPMEELVRPGLLAVGEPDRPVRRAIRRGRVVARGNARAAVAADRVAEPAEIIAAVVVGDVERVEPAQQAPNNDEHVLQVVPEDAEEVANIYAAVQQPAGGACCVCLGAPATHAFVPCGHRCCCAVCALRIQTRCPLCRTEFTEIFYIMVNL